MANDPSPETALLAPLDPSVDTNPDDWPEYELTNARVHLPGSRDSNVSLLLATEHHPLTVVGQLQPVPAALARRYRGSSTKRADAVEVTPVKLFAYGQYSDGSVALWAAGRAGWFALKPSRAYREVYEGMVEAVKLLYFVADVYRKPKKGWKGFECSAKILIERYAEEVMGDPDAYQEALEKICEHRDFMFVSMLAGKEGIDWAKNPLYQYLRKKFPQDHEAAEQRLKGPTGKQAARARQESVETSSTTSSLKRKRGRQPVNRSTDVVSLGSSSAASSVVKETQPKPAEASKPRGATKASTLAVRRTRHNPPAPTTETLIETPVAQILDPLASSPEVSDSDEEIPHRQAHKGKSSLRPRPSKGAKKSDQSQAPIAADDESDDELAAAHHRSSPTSAKRKQDNLSHPRHRKRRGKQEALDEGIDIPSSPSTSEEASETHLTPDATAGAASALNHAPDPVREDTWSCALAGCTHKVYTASLPASQRLILEHYALHAYDDDQRVQLVKKLQAPSLPASHLMERVRVQARIEGFPGSRVAGSRFPVLPLPVPVVQRY